MPFRIKSAKKKKPGQMDSAGVPTSVSQPLPRPPRTPSPSNRIHRLPTSFTHEEQRLYHPRPFPQQFPRGLQGLTMSSRDDENSGYSPSSNLAIRLSPGADVQRQQWSGDYDGYHSQYRYNQSTEALPTAYPSMDLLPDPDPRDRQAPAGPLLRSSSGRPSMALLDSPPHRYSPSPSNEFHDYLPETRRNLRASSEPLDEAAASAFSHRISNGSLGRRSYPTMRLLSEESPISLGSEHGSGQRSSCSSRASLGSANESPVHSTRPSFDTSRTPGSMPRHNPSAHRDEIIQWEKLPYKLRKMHTAPAELVENEKGKKKKKGEVDDGWDFKCIGLHENHMCPGEEVRGRGIWW